jgi:hypothetical protein
MWYEFEKVQNFLACKFDIKNWLTSNPVFQGARPNDVRFAETDLVPSGRAVTWVSISHSMNYTLRNFLDLSCGAININEALPCSFYV